MAKSRPTDMILSTVTNQSFSEQLITVYIPTFNRLALLKRAVDSVLSQDHRNLELIIVDDGSTDGTREYLVGLTLKDSRVTIVTKSGMRGAPASRNAALAKARGAYITGLDDDDYFKSNHLSTLLSAYQQQLSCVFVRERNWKDLIFAPLFFLSGKVAYEQLIYFNFIGNQVFTETWKLSSAGGFDERLPAAQDYETWLRLLRTFGPARAVLSDTYVVDQEHNLGRITDNKINKIHAYEMISAKPDLFPKRKYRASFALRKALHGCDVPAGDILYAALNVNNLRMLIKYITSKIL